MIIISFPEKCQIQWEGGRHGGVMQKNPDISLIRKAAPKVKLDDEFVKKK